RSTGGLFFAGLAVIVLTPAVERYDLISHLALHPVQLTWFFLAFGAVAPVLLPLGLCLPSLLDQAGSGREWGRLYSVNALGAVSGALLAAWLLLPGLGFAATSVGLGVLLAGYVLLSDRGARPLRLGLLVAALAFAWIFDSGVGTNRVIGRLAAGEYSVVAHRETPDSAVSVVQFQGGERALVIDGFHAATELDLGHYMRWMGYLPMLLHPSPKQALVICFGTGQTANAVRLEGPEALTIVDINPAVFEFGRYFSKNQAVLDDPKVAHLVMDGRAYLRRSKSSFDVITLEPMPPNYAGVNSLYSKEFYLLARERLSEGGSMAQWVTFRLVAPELNASIVKTFAAVFPNAQLWIDPKSQTGIVIGSKSDVPLVWPGLQKLGLWRDLSNDEILQAVALQGQDLQSYAAHGEIITDDNQLLAYGPHIHDALINERLLQDNLDLVKGSQSQRSTGAAPSDLGEMQEAVKLAAKQAAEAAKRDMQTIMGLAADRLVSAAFAGDTAQIEILVQQGAEQGVDINRIDPKYNITPLSAAASRGQLPAIETLLRLGADIETQDKIGFTALMNAAMNKQMAAVKLLVAKGAKLDAINMGRQTAADLAKMMGAVDVAEYLKDQQKGK
ncbi:MAG: fused MFS/spermidine synthase, partial [Oligoflexia bacterium]|nr:fused MFS/spermidine synthase [Oligoflexia bacterium]